MIEILKKLADENMVKALIIILAISRETRLFLKIILQYKVDKNKGK